MRVDRAGVCVSVAFIARHIIVVGSGFHITYYFQLQFPHELRDIDLVYDPIMLTFWADVCVILISR